MKKAAKKGKITDFFASNAKPKASKTSQDEEMDIEPETTSVSKSPKKKDPGAGLPPIDDFVGELYSWKPKLKHFTDSAKFKSLYTFVKKEYETQTVLFL